ncbi:hypothetical protein VTI28DRAFT_3881 [Corynascus sepedonium]
MSNRAYIPDRYVIQVNVLFRTHASASCPRSGCDRFTELLVESFPADDYYCGILSYTIDAAALALNHCSHSPLGHAIRIWTTRLLLLLWRRPDMRVCSINLLKERSSTTLLFQQARKKRQSPKPALKPAMHVTLPKYPKAKELTGPQDFYQFSSAH